MQTSLSCRSLLCLGLFAAACSDPPAGSDSSAVGSVSSDLTAEQCQYFAVNSKVNICHRTGARRKPFQLVRTNLASCGGHTGHAGDYVAYNDSDCDGGGCFPLGAPFDGTVECCPGLAPVNGHCADVNECLTNNGGCGPNTTCTNTVGGRTCSCAPGYAKSSGDRQRDGRDRYDDGDDDDDRDDDGDAHDRDRHESGRCGHFHGALQCVDVNECATNNGGCPSGSTCQNNTGAPPTCIGLCTGVTCAASDQCHVAGTCNPATGACSNPIATNGASCDDGNACTGSDTCSAGTCGGTALAVDDSNACTTDSCDPATGVAHAAISSDDGNACTSDSCDPSSGVAHTAVATDDGDACTADTCDPAHGPVHVAISVDDGNACTTDSCDPASGAVYTHVAVDDNNACTADSCDPSTGVAHMPVGIDDGDPCTADACDPIAGVSHTPTTLPAATHQWTFNDGTSADSIGVADGSLLGGATIAQGALVVNNVASAPNQASVGQRMAAPIADSYTTKTLVTWVALDNTTQHGGSALTLESTTTNAFAQVFDGVVYAERTAGQWMAGSDNWNRTAANNGGAAETSTGTVAIAIAYDSANGITIYRDGAFYAGYTASNAQAFAGGASDVQIGVRHTGCNGNCWLSGQIDEARIYPVALNACQVKLLAPVPGFVATGCSDGTREGFASIASYPGIAACSGGWSIPGVRTSTTVNPACGRVSGNTSSNPSGAGCNVADLCSAGFHVCNNATEVASKTGPAGCNDAMVNDAFFIQREASYGYYACLDWSDLDQYQNDIWGCGGTGPLMSGLFTSKPCGVLNATTGDGGGAMAAPWNLNVGGLSSYVEAATVTKSGSEHGGVLCCAD